MATKKAVNKTTKETKKSNTSVQTIIIAVLATLLGCFVLILGILMATGVIKFSDKDNNGPIAPLSDEPTSTTSTTTPDNTETSAGTTPGGVTCYDKTRAQVYNLEFCLPDDFVEASRANDGAYVYNLVDDDGWAEVKAYFLKTDRTPTQFINYLSSGLKVVNQNYTVNGTTWVRAEAGDYMQALATKSDGYLYAVFFSIKLDSDETREAWQMIPKTIVITN